MKSLRPCISFAIILAASTISYGQPNRHTPLLDTYISPLNHNHQTATIRIDFSADTYRKYSNATTRISIRNTEKPLAAIKNAPSFKYHRPSATRELLTGCGILLMGVTQYIIFPDYPTYRPQPLITFPTPYHQ